MSALRLGGGFARASPYRPSPGFCKRLLSDSQFESIRFRHAGLEAEQVVTASLRLLDYMPRVAE